MTAVDTVKKTKAEQLTSIRLNYLAAAQFTGSDAAAFLQSQLSADIEALASGEASFAAYCNPRGQVIALLLIGREGDTFRMAAAAGLLPQVLERLRIFVFRSKVEFALQPGLQVSGMTDPDTGGFAPGPAGLVYRFSGDPAEDEQARNLWKRSELQHNVAWLQAETSEKYIPQMLGYDQLGAISFSKGCYPGQEIVARARYLGRVKRKPLKLALDNMPPLDPGQKVEVLRAGEWAGAVVVDSAPGSDGDGLLFTVAADAPQAEATSLRVGGKDYRCATM
jgi:folate-binding protein YgfZ